MRLTAPDVNGVPGIHVIDGQVVVATAGKPGTELNVQVDDQIYLVTFRDADARLAIDVRRWLPDGADPMDEPARSAVDIYVPNGEIEYSVGGAPEKVTLKAPTMRTLIARTGPDAVEVTNEVVFSAVDQWQPAQPGRKWAARRGYKELIADDPSGQPLLGQLRELTQNRRVEVRNLAVQCLTLLGDFEGLLPC